MAYSDAQKAIAVEIARRNDGVLSAFILADIREKISAPNLSAPIVRRWISDSAKLKLSREKTKLVAVEVVAAQALDQMYEDIARKYLKHAAQEHVLNKLNGKDAVTAAAIATDKMRLLRDLPTVIIDAAPQLTALGRLFEQFGINGQGVFEDLVQQYTAALTNLEQRAESDHA
jgi:hypothetical protein